MPANNQEIFSKVKNHLQELDSFEVKDLDDRSIDSCMSLLTIDKSVHEDEASIKALLAIVVKILHNSKLDIDFDKIIELLSGLLLNIDFENIVQFFKFPSINEALASPNENLQVLALKVSSRADPPDIISNTEIIPKMVALLATKQSSINVVNEIEKSLGVLMRGELIRRRLLSDSVISTLVGMKASKDTVLKTRLLDLVLQILQLVKEHELPEELYLFNDFTSDNDILYTLTLIQYYTQILNIVDSSLNSGWLLQKIIPQAELIGKLHMERNENTDIEYFALNEIALFFKKFSYISPSNFKLIDQKYIKLTNNDDFLLTSLNPGYLVTSHAALLKTLNLTEQEVAIFKNLIPNESSFLLVKPKITTEKLQRLSYVAFINILEKLSEFQYSALYLLQELPQVMNKLLQGDNVIERESYQLRRTTIENLTRYPSEDLSVWKEALEGEHYKLTHGKPMAIQTLIHDGTL